MKAVPWEDLSGILKDILSRFVGRMSMPQSLY